MRNADSLLGACAASLTDLMSRRQWKHALNSLRDLRVSWSDLVLMNADHARAWLSWDADQFRVWEACLQRALTNLGYIPDGAVSVTSDLDAVVPEWLQKLDTAPWVFYRGDITLMDAPTIGFSGQREAGVEALAITRMLGVAAAEQGFTVVSGGARGVDVAAHRSVLETGGATVVILPQGIATWQTPLDISASQFQERILVLGEDLPWEGWSTESAMRRNRMIVNVSQVFTVPQSGTRGGSHSTGMYALNHDRVTYVPDLGPEFPGNRKLLSHGARPLVAPKDGFDLHQLLAESIPQARPAQSSMF